MKACIKACFCPNCKKKLFRRKIKRNKPTTCGSCKFIIKNPYEVFVPKSKYLKLKEETKK